MSRTNPTKRKPRTAKRTLLLFGEGLSEAMFLKLLRKIYSLNTGVATNVKEGTGGVAYNIVSDAAKIPGFFDKVAVVLDNDKENKEMQRCRLDAKTKGFQLIENTPCIEAVMLSIIESGIDFSNRGSSWCKQQFESRYIAKKNKNDLREYERLFSRILLNEARKRVESLNEILDLIEGNF